MKRTLLKLAAVGAVAAFLGFVVAASGLIPITASGGHWAITRWVLSFSMRRSVETHAIGTKVPPLDRPGLVLRGATQYDMSCRPCHGAPGQERSEVLQELTPQPPWLATEATRWDPAELFHIVKGGVKMTGMPAWPVRERDDEVWAMVAFLRVLPTLDAEGYRRLALGALREGRAGGPLAGMGDAPPAVLETCARCHGVDGRGRGPGAFPALAGQSATYLAGALVAYARERRPSGIMLPVATELSAEDMESVAGWYARRSPPEPHEAVDTALVRAGERLARAGSAADKVPACARCHGPHGDEQGPGEGSEDGDERGPREGPEHGNGGGQDGAASAHNPHYPYLAGQDPAYLELQLRLFRAGRRGGGPYAHVMEAAARHLSDEQIEALAAFYAAQAPHPHATTTRVPDLRGGNAATGR